MVKKRKIDDFLGSYSRELSSQRKDTLKELREYIDLTAKTTAEKVIALFADRILRELEQINQRLQKLEEKLERLERGLTRTSMEKRETAKARLKNSKGRIARLLESYLDKHRYILGSEVKQKLGISMSRLEDTAEELGAIVIDVGGDIAVLMLQHLEEFDALLSTVNTPDPIEASQKLDIYSRLFDKMRKAGLIYYDASRNSWKRL
jgi:inactivated superfamily I helicase